MQCPECKSDHIRKNGINRQGKQNYICVNCQRQFIKHLIHQFPNQLLSEKKDDSLVIMPVSLIFDLLLLIY